MVRVRDYRHKWDILTQVYGENCAYCHVQPATQIDHVIPVSWRNCNHISNLRPACAWCNLLAGAQVFSEFDEKYEFLRAEREKKSRFRYKRTVCVHCKLPFQNPLHSPNYFLCAECYDWEYNKTYRKRKGWASWLELLHEAGFIVDAHRHLGEIVRMNSSTTIPTKDKANLLAEAYAAFSPWEIEGVNFALMFDR